MQLKVKTLLNDIQPIPGFVYTDIRRGAKSRDGGPRPIEATIEPHAGIPAKCSRCQEPCACYDTLPPRDWLFVPPWNILTLFLYAPRRVNCPTDGVVVEYMPWCEGKRPVTKAMTCFLARWARRLSWRDTARVFHTSWECVYRSVESYVQWGLAHRTLEGILAIGLDEIHWGAGQLADSFLTVIYQIDGHCRRLLWVGRRRTQATVRRGLAALGAEVVQGLRFVCSDMCKPYLKVIAAEIGGALHILDRFHVTMNINKALDKVRRQECGRFRQAASVQAGPLKNMRWTLLRQGVRVRGEARRRLKALVTSKLATARAWILKETFQHFWKYKSVKWAGYFLDVWTTRAMRSRLEPMKKVARTLRTHRELLLNWFRAKGELSNGAVEGLNNKIRVVTRRSYGFRTYEAMEIALYHTLGRLPEPDEFTHRFC